MSTPDRRSVLLGISGDPEEERKAKQEYILEEIVSQKYDRNEFASYMFTCKEDGTNLDNWTLLELMDIVKDFKETHKPLENQDDQDVVEDSQDAGVEESQDEGTGSVENYQDMPSQEPGESEEINHSEEEDKEVEPVFKKTKKEISEISYYKKSQLKVAVHDGLIKKGGFLSFSFISYKVSLEPLSYWVRRREEDFTFLRKYLWKMYPSQFIPPLIMPSKKMTEESILKKEKYFTKFLTNVLRNR